MKFLSVPHLALKAQEFAIIGLKHKRAVSSNQKQKKQLVQVTQQKGEEIQQMLRSSAE